MSESGRVDLGPYAAVMKLVLVLPRESLPSKLGVLLLVGRTCRSLARALVGRMLPARLKRPLRIWRDLAPDARKAYALRRLSSRLPRRTRREPSLTRLCRRITFVCCGNIMRSPFAAALLQAELRRLGIEGFCVTSCGTDAQSGRPADHRAIALAREFGVGLDRHLASRVTRTTIDESDVVIAMDFVNEAKLIAAFPDASRKILLLPRAPGERGPVEIPDPYDGNVDEVRACFDVVHQRVKHLMNQLAQVHVIPNGSANLTTPLAAGGG